MNTANSLKDLGKLTGAGKTKPNKPTKSHKPHNNRPKQNACTVKAASRNKSFILATQTTIKCFQAIATLNKVEKRSDLQKLLSKSKHELPPRLRGYFEMIGVFDGQQNLTPAGHKLREQGEITLSEKGLYNLWYCEHPLLDNQLIAVQRVDAHKAQVANRVQAKKGEAGIQMFLLTTDTRCAVFNNQTSKWDDSQLKVTEIDIISEPTSHNTGNLTWFVDNNNEIKLSATLKIKLPSNDRYQKKEKELELPVAYFGIARKSADLAYEALAASLDGHWNKKRKTIQLAFSNSIDNWATVSSCELRRVPKELKLTSIGAMSVDSFNKVAIEPLEESAESKKWLQAWLKHYFAQRPVAPLQAEKDQLAWRSKPQLAHHDIEPMGQHEILQLLEEQGRTKAYWNATATMDLVPAQPQSVGLPLTLQDGDTLTPENLLNALTGNKQITQMLIADRYYRTSSQRKLLHALSDETASSGNLLLTAKSPDNQDLPDGWECEHLSRLAPENHDRYWVLFTNSGPMVWKVSTSMDFLKPSSATTSWQVHGYPTFTPMNTTDLPKFIQSAVEANQ